MDVFLDGETISVARFDSDVDVEGREIESSEDFYISYRVRIHTYT